MDTSVCVKSFITSTHYWHITVLPEDTPFTCSCAEMHFHVLYLTLVSKQICLKQLKSITTQTAPHKRYALHQPFSLSVWRTCKGVHVRPHFKLCTTIQHEQIEIKGCLLISYSVCACVNWCASPYLCIALTLSLAILSQPLEPMYTLWCMA